MREKNGSAKLLAIAISTALATSVAASDMPESTQKQKTMQPREFTSQPQTVILPAVAPTVKNGVDFFVNSSFIYWNVSLTDGDITYANRGVPSPFGNTTGSTVVPGVQYQIDALWEPGCKIGAGFEFEHDGWDVYAEWTWLNPVNTKSSATNSVENITNHNFLLVNWGTFQSAEILYASNTLTLHFNEIDLDLGRNFFVSKYMTMRPSIGMKAMWLNYSTKRVVHSNNSSDDFYWEYLTIKEKTWNIGPRASANAMWHITKEWGVYTNFAFSALSSWMKTSVNVSENTNALDDLTVEQNVNGNRFSMLPLLEVAAGFEYMTWFCDESYMFNLKAGWESQFMMPIQAHQPQEGPLELGALDLQGLTIEAGFHF